MLTIEDVKNDLRSIKYQQKIIQTYRDTKQQYQRRLETLQSLKKTEEVERNIKKIKEVLAMREKEFDENRLIDLESRYLKALGELPDTDRVIITKIYIQGKTYFKTSMEMSYSFESIKKKLKNALKKLLKILNRKDG